MTTPHRQPYGWAIWAFGAMIGFAAVKFFGWFAIAFFAIIWFLTFKYVGCRRYAAVTTTIIEGEVNHDDNS